MKKILFVILFKSIVITVLADVRLPAVISNNMVLQQNSLITLWGWSDAAEKV